MHRGPRRIAAAHVVAGYDQRRVRDSKLRERLHEHVNPLARGQLAQISDDRPLDGPGLSKGFSSWRRLELLERYRVWHHAYTTRRYTQPRQLPAFGVGDRKDSGGAVHDPHAQEEIEQPFCGAASLQIRRRPVGGKQIRNTRGPQVSRSNGAG